MRILAGLCLASALAAAPVIRDFEPKGAQQGKTFQILLKGSDLTVGAQLQTTLPAGISRLSPPSNLMKADTELPFLIELKKDAPIGVYPLRLVTRDGISNVVLFSVGGFPEREEIESKNYKQSNGTLKEAEKLPLPAIVTGTLSGGDVDVYSFTAKAGEKIVFEVDASIAGSAIDPAIEILDAAGNTIAHDDDAPGAGVDSRIEFAAPKPGTYYVRVHDSKYSEQSVNFYRLKAGSYSFAEALFPLGWQRGKPVSVELSGGNLPKVLTANPDTSSKSRYVPIRVDGSASVPLLFELSDDPQTLEPATAGPHPLAPGVVMNGRIAEPKQVDEYSLAVKPGEHWVLEVKASRLGTSRLDALMTVRDAIGKKIVSRDDLASADPVIPLEVPKDVSELRIAIEDLLGRGGAAYGYQLVARQGPADFTVSLVTPYVNIPAGGTAEVEVVVQRRGYDGDLQLTIPDLPKEFHQAGGHVATAAAQQRFDDPNPRFSAVRSSITVTADEDAAAQPFELGVIGIAETPLGKIERLADGPGLVVGVKGLRQRPLTAQWLEMKLPAAVAPRVPAKLVTKVSEVRMAQGVSHALAYKLERGTGVRAVGKVRQNVTTAVGNLRINTGLNPGMEEGEFEVNTNFATPTEKFDMLLEATVEVGGKEVTVTAPIVTYDIVQGYEVELERKEYAAAAGSKFEIQGRVVRDKTFEGGLVKIEAADLPEGAQCAPVDVPAGETAFRLSCDVAASTASGASEIRISSSAPDTGQRTKDTYKIPDVMATLKVEGARTAQR